MRLLIVTNDTVLAGGTANSLLTVLDNMPDEIDKIYVLMPGRGTLQKILLDKNVSVIFMNYEPAWTDKKFLTFMDLQKEWNNYKCAKKLARLLAEKDIDIVYTNSGIIDVGAMAAFIAGKRHIWHHREFIHKHFHKKYILECKYKWLLKKADIVITVSKVLLRELQKRYHIENGVVLNNKFAKEKYYIGNHKLFDNEKLRCVVVGAMYEKKHQIDAVLAGYEVVQKHKIPIELYLVGGGNADYISFLDKQITKLGLKECVHIMKYVNDITILRNEFDIEISCSQWEGFGRNVIEGMLGGLLVIGANSGATKELVKAYKNGLLYDPGNEHDLAKQLIWVWENKKRAEQIAGYGQKWALNKMLDDTYAEDLKSILT